MLLVANLTVLRLTFSGTQSLSEQVKGLSFTKPVNNRVLLWLTRLQCYAGRDLRAAWFEDGIPRTDNTKYKPYARWALQHWSMYFSFVELCRPSGSILDLGCGIGNMTANLACVLSDSQIVGVDLNKSAISTGKRRFSSTNLKLILGNVLDETFSEQFDFVFAIEILEHIHADEHNSFIHSALAPLKPGGLLFISTPNALDEVDEPWGHIGLLNRRRAQQFFERYGSIIIQQGYLDNTKLELNQVSEFHSFSELSDMMNGRFKSQSHFWVVMRKP